MPHVLAGAKFEQGWGAISGVVGYDSNVEEFAGKLRLDVKFTDMFSAFIMGGYQSGYDNDFDPVTAQSIRHRNWFGAWEGDWAAWGGALRQGYRQGNHQRSGCLGRRRHIRSRS